MYSIYRINTRDGHTYIGMTSNIDRRFRDHRTRISEGILGLRSVQATLEVIFEILDHAQSRSDARILEARYIASDMIDNPKNCNDYIGYANSFGTAKRRTLVRKSPTMLSGSP